MPSSVFSYYSKLELPFVPSGIQICMQSGHPFNHRQSNEHLHQCEWCWFILNTTETDPFIRAAEAILHPYIKYKYSVSPSPFHITNVQDNSKDDAMKSLN